MRGDASPGRATRPGTRSTGRKESAIKVVASYRDAPAAYIAASVLAAEDIPHEIRDEHTVGINWMWSHAVGGVKIAVPEDQADIAQALLFPDAPEVDDPPPAPCSACGSEEVRRSKLGAVSLLVSYLLGVVVPFRSFGSRCARCGSRQRDPGA